MRFLRWVLFLPLAFVVAVVANVVLSMGAVLTQNQNIVSGVSSFVFTLFLVLAAGIIAPSKHFGVAAAVGSVMSVLAILTYVLGSLGFEAFAEKAMPESLIVALFQVLGALYGAFLVEPFTVKTKTMDPVWRQINALGTLATLLALVLCVGGGVVGMMGRGWATLAIGCTALALGVGTWAFPYLHLTSRVYRMNKELEKLR